MNRREKMLEILKKAKQPDEKLSTIGETPTDTSIRLVVAKPGTDEPMIARAEIMAKNSTFHEALTKCGPGMTEFPFNYPCLAPSQGA